MISVEQTSIQVVPLGAADETFLWTVLCHAAHMEGPDMTQRARSNPDLRRYVQDFGRPSDFGFKAQSNGTPVAAAFCRSWTATDHGYGFLDERTPELAMACLPGYDGRGIGTQLLTAVVAVADHRCVPLSLSVRDTNPAVRLYERHGFVRVSGSEVRNRVGGRSFSMRREGRPGACRRPGHD